jgi:ABC-type polysaccharide/polyol phosphate transport system ATPase subunit
VDLPSLPDALRGLHLSAPALQYDPAVTRIAVEGLAVRYDLQQERVMSVREYVVRRLRGERFPTQTLWPIEHVSFSVQAGESFGIVGRNGAGKSTLLKVIAGIVPPTRGRVEVRGHLSPLLELGAGFDMELSRSRERSALRHAARALAASSCASASTAIAEFAELTPVHRRAAQELLLGHGRRLAFAIATDSDPGHSDRRRGASVGDAPFSANARSAGRASAPRRHGPPVTHDLTLLTESCSRACSSSRAPRASSAGGGDRRALRGAHQAAEHDAPRVSVVVPCYRPGDLIDGCLADLLDQDLAGPYEVIVVESSGDGTAERLRKTFPRCRVIAPPSRTWPAEAQNLGVAAATGPFIAVTNHDCVIPRDWLRRLLARHERARTPPSAARVANGTPASLVGTAAYWSEFNEFTPGRPGGPVPGVPQCMSASGARLSSVPHRFRRCGSARKS